MIFKKNNQANKQSEPVCNVDKNTNECSLISEIHELQDKRDKYNERLKICEMELANLSILIPSHTLERIRCTSRYSDTYNLKDIIQDWNADFIVAVSKRMLDIADLKREPEYLYEQISLINQKISKLKEQLNIQ